MTTLITLKKELSSYKNTLVIDGNKVVRLVDVVDGEEDFYWVFDNRSKGIYWSSCVGGWIPLKGFISEKDYTRLVHQWNLNNLNKAI